MALRSFSKLPSLLKANLLKGHSLEQRLLPFAVQILPSTRGVCVHPSCDYSSLHSRQRISLVPCAQALDSRQSFLNRAVSWQKNLFSMRLMSGGGVVAKFTQDIDLEKLREDIRKEARATGQNLQLVDRVRDIVAQRCDEVIANLDEDGKKKLRVIQLEHNFLYSEGHDILSPEVMTNVDWVEAMDLTSKSKRLKHYIFLQKRYRLKKAFQHKQAALKEEMQNRPKFEEYEHGRIFMRIYEQTMRKWLNYRLASSMTFGLPLVLDMDYEDLMRPSEQKNTASQLHSVYCLNRADEEGEPFHLHFTSCHPNNAMLKLMQVKTQDSPILLATVTEKNYLDLFDKDRLVYLSPQGRQVMREFDPEAVYIIGAFNDKAIQKPVSYARAMEQGIRCQRLPLDEHVTWNQGTKTLTLDQMMKIMLDVKRNLPWKTALRHIPQRKLR